MTSWFAIALNIRGTTLKKIICKTAAQRSWKKSYPKRKPEGVIAPRKIPKDTDVWLMSARWWTSLPEVNLFKRDNDETTRSVTISLAIGQGFNIVPPLQLANVYATLANGGTVYRPRLIKQLESSDGHIVKKYGPEKQGAANVREMPEP
jgi:cell division protein FtsI/penicillin-binding protein 2